MRMPWDPPETHVLTIAELPSQSHQVTTPLEDTVTLLQRDFAYAMTHTAVMVHSPHDALRMLVNTRRGQIIPVGECRFKDGTTLEFQDIGMPQPNVPAMTVQELVAMVWRTAAEIGLELV